MPLMIFLLGSVARAEDRCEGAVLKEACRQLYKLAWPSRLGALLQMIPDGVGDPIKRVIPTALAGLIIAIRDSGARNLTVI